MADITTRTDLDTDPRLAALTDAGEPAFVVSADARQILWANEQAREILSDVQVAGALDPSISSQISRMPIPSGGGFRLLRIKLLTGGVERTLTCRAEGIIIGSETSALVIVLDAQHRGEQEPGEPDTEAEPSALAAPAEFPQLPIRFVWQSDEEGKVGWISPELLALLGPEAGILGKTWTDLDAMFGLDSSGRLGEALTRRDTWSGVTISWPLSGSMRLPMELAGLPVFDRDRTFLGFRGFGVVREPPYLDIPVPNEDEPLSPIPEAEGATAPPVEDEAEPADPLVSAPVLPFRTPPRPDLKPSEHSALQEIARTLSARTNGIGNSTAIPGDEGPVLPPASEDSPTIPVGFLDTLPIALLVHRAGIPVFANRAMLDLVKFEDVDALTRHGLDRLFEARGGGAQAESGVWIRASEGCSVHVHAQLKTTDWAGEPATLTIFSPVVAAAGTTGERELRAILDTATDGVVVLDANGRIASVNRSAEALFGYENAELEGRSFTLLLSADSHRAALEYLEGLRKNGVASVMNDGREVIGIARRGGSIPLFMTLGRIGDSDEPKFCAVLRDITQFRKAEEELRTAKVLAERASSQKSDFLARISHEIRTPLNAVLGFAEVMIEERFGPLGNERYRDYLRDIHESGSHIISLVNDLLDLSKIEAGRLELTFAGINLNEIVSGSVSLLQPQANRNRIIIRTSLAPRLPSVMGDQRSLKQIVLNLLSNAVKYTPPGGQVIVSTALTDLGQAVIRVRDTGLGMSEKEILTALEPFRQLSTGSAAGGTGLGLPLTKALVEANRATFAIQSAVGTGTLVEVIFPPTRVLSE